MLTTRLSMLAAGLGVTVVLSACSTEITALTPEPAPAADQAPAEVAFVSDDVEAEGERPVVVEQPDEIGADPFSPQPFLRAVAADAQTDAEGRPAGQQEAGLYGGTTRNECDADALDRFLSDEPLVAEAWADALDIETADIETYIDDLRPEILPVDRRVTNHGYVDGVATPFDSVLAAGTAVLVDRQGTPRVRCACGNPLDTPKQPTPTRDPKPTPTPVPTATPTPEVEIDVEPDPTPAPQLGFCATWGMVGPTIAGGPADAADIFPYLERSVAAFTALVEAAEREDDFPAFAYDDLVAYLAGLEEVLATGDLSGGDAALRGRVEGFLVRYCEHGALQGSPRD